MSAKTVHDVHVGGQVVPAGSGSDHPLAGEITNPSAWDGEHASSGEPPRSGKGSGLEAWRDHAKAEGVDVPDDASRDDIITLIDAR